MKETGLNEYAYHFSVDYYGIDVGTFRIFIDIWWIKCFNIMFRFVKKMFIRLLSLCAIGSFCELLVSNSKGL